MTGIVVNNTSERWVAYSADAAGNSTGLPIRVVSRRDLVRLIAGYVNGIAAGSETCDRYPPECIEKGVRVVWKREFVPRLDPGNGVQSGS